MTGMQVGPGETLVVPSTDAGVRLPRARRRSARHRSAKEKLGIALLLFFAAMAIFGPLLAPYDPSAPSATILSPPTWSHLLGTTQTGQDVLSQLLVGARSSILVALAAAAVATLISIVVGISSGYLQPLAAESLSVVTNVFLVIPALPLAIVIAGYLPTHGDVAVAAVVALTGWSWGARALRAQTLSLRGRDFVTAARIIGESKARIIFWEIGPTSFRSSSQASSSRLFTQSSHKHRCRSLAWSIRAGGAGA